jgi:hypothetical protein
MNRPSKSKAGFTLIELMLSMAFVGALLVAIAVTTIHIMGTYTKGLTVREVNQAGRTISEDIQRTIAASVPFTVGGGADSHYIERDGGGRLCTGDYTYAWNNGNTSELGGDASIHIYNLYSDGDNNEPIRLVKVSDAGAALCLDPEQEITREAAKELLVAGDRSLSVQSLTVSSGASSVASGQALYAITLVIGTSNRGENWVVLDPSNTSCTAPKAADANTAGNENFCAINQFDIIARAGNRAGSL